MADLEDMNGAPGEGEEGEEQDQEPKYENLEPEFLEEVCDVFDIFDKNKDETIETTSLATVLRWLKFNPTDTEIKDYISRYDPTNKEFITLESVKTIVNELMVNPDTVDQLIEALKLFDHDNDGKITVPEMRWFLTQLGDKMAENEVDDMLKEVDKENTGFVEIMELSRITFNIKEEKTKEDKKKK